MEDNASFLTLPELMLTVGKFFLGKPYRAGTLERRGPEHLVVNLREFDCMTFIENVVGLAQQMKSRRKSFQAFRTFLQRIRYRQGKVRGYASRLHYFSDWIHDNRKKDILRDITAEIGGRSLKKKMTFMTAHPDLYPQLKDKRKLRSMKSIEERVSKRSFHFIPKEDFKPSESRIEDGDLIAITTNREGLDVQHVGLAAKVKSQIHLLHASSTEGKVVLSRKTLYRYLMENKTRSGIIVARLKNRG